MTDLAELQRLATEATPGPWKVVTDVHPHMLGGEHKERRIGTVWEHPQLQGPVGVVNISYGIGASKGSPAISMVAISEADAAYIAACSPEVILRLVRIAQAAEKLEASTRGPEGAVVLNGASIRPILALREALGEPKP